MKKRGIIIGVVTAAIVVAGAIGVGAWAGQDDSAEKRGTIGAATYELSVEPDDGGLEVAFEVQSSAPDETWQLVVEQNGTPILTGERSTDEDAELDVDVQTSDRSGEDTFTVSATGPDGEQHTVEITR